MTNAILRGKPDAGNPHVRFDEGEVASAKPRRGSLLYKSIIGLVVALVSTAAMSAVTTEWQGALGKEWNNAENWSAGIPAADGVARFGEGVTQDTTVTVTGAAADVGGLVFDTPYTVSNGSIVKAHDVSLLQGNQAIKIEAKELGDEEGTWYVAEGSTLTIKALSGTASHTKTGPGTVDLSNTSPSSFSVGITTVGEGELLFKSGSICGTSLVIGDGEHAAVARGTYVSEKYPNYSIFGNSVYGTVRVRNKGVFDLKTCASSEYRAQITPMGSVTVEKGGEIWLGLQTLDIAVGNHLTHALSLSGSILSDRPDVARVDLRQCRVVVPDDVPAKVLAQCSFRPKQQYEDDYRRTFHTTFEVGDNPDLPVEFEVSGTIKSSWNERDGYVKEGAGVMRVTGASTYGGQKADPGGMTDVMVGTLLVDNVTGSGTGSSKVYVYPGACVGGTGTIGGLVDKEAAPSGGGANSTYAKLSATGDETAQAVVAPGTIDDETGAWTVGTLTVGSAEMLNPAIFGDYSTLRIGVSPDGVSRLAVNGKVTVSGQGTVLEVCSDCELRELEEGYAAVLSATEGIEGEFQSAVWNGQKITPKFNADRTEMYIRLPMHGFWIILR